MNEYWTLIQVHNHKNDSGLGTTLRDVSELCFFRMLKTCWLRRHRIEEINSGDISVNGVGGGCPTNVLICLAQFLLLLY